MWLLRKFALFIKLSLMLASAYTLTIGYSFYQLSEGIETRDVSILREYIDWPSMRDQLKADFLAETAKERPTEVASGTSNGVENLGNILAGGLASVMIDAMVTPERLVVYLNSQRIERFGIADLSDLKFAGIDEFSFKYHGVRVFVRRNNLTWRVVRVQR